MLPGVLQEGSVVDFFAVFYWLLQRSPDKLCQFFAFYFCCFLWLIRLNSSTDSVYEFYNLGYKKTVSNFLTTKFSFLLLAHPTISFYIFKAIINTNSERLNAPENKIACDNYN